MISPDERKAISGSYTLWNRLFTNRSSTMSTNFGNCDNTRIHSQLLQHRLFDYSMTHRMDSDFPSPYFGPEVLHTLKSPVDKKKRRTPIVWIANNCYAHNSRELYAKVRAFLSTS